MSQRHRLLIVDDSRFMRRAIAEFFAEDPRVEVCGEAADGNDALNAVASLNPDVVTLDINMPVMDGLTALKHLMIRTPRPTLMLSTLVHEGARVTFDSLRYGALDFILKPSQLDGQRLDEKADEIRRKVYLATAVEVEALRYIRANTQKKPNESSPCRRVAVMGAGEGGYNALLKIVPRLRPASPSEEAYVVVLYAESEHVDAFAAYLDRYSALRVCRARDGEPLRGGTCYMVSGVEYATFVTDGQQLLLHITPAPFPWRRGSINRLLFSAAELLGAQAFAALLSGAGEDGGEGLVEVQAAGGFALIQDPASCFDKEMVQHALALCDSNCLTIPDSGIGEMFNEFLRY